MLLALRPSDLNQDLYHCLTHSQAFRLKLGLIPSVPQTQAMSLAWNFTTGFPGPVACYWQFLGLLTLHSHMIQSPIIDLFVYIDIGSIGSISLKDPR